MITSRSRNLSKLLILFLAVTMLFSTMSMGVFASPPSPSPSSSQSETNSSTTHANALTQAELDNIDATNINIYSAYLTTDINQRSEWSDYATLSREVGDATYYVRRGMEAGLYSTYQRINGRNSDRADSDASINDMTIALQRGMNTHADTDKAFYTLAGLRNMINLVLGIVVVGITLLLAVYTAFDVCYISFPAFRNKCEDAKTAGGGAMVKKGSNGESKLRWVTDEAQYAVEQAETAGDGTSALGTYLKKRVVAYVMVSIVLFMLLTGNITVITNLALRVVQYVVDTIGTL